MSEMVLRCIGLGKTFAGDAEALEILRDVNLEAEAGSTISITGASGCGKSTLLSILGGLDAPTKGEAWVDGIPLHSTPERDLAGFRLSSVGFVFQFHYLLKDFTAMENVAMPGIVAGLSRPRAYERAEGLLTEIGLADRASHYPSKMSGGERQRVSIARALMNEPSIVFADEPTGNLDERSARSAEDILFGAVAKRGTTLVLVTHDLRLAGRAEQRFRLHEGELFPS
ncbi:MAG: ABC transporter ATP-binding protein [Spirochaetes bacterium]|nr:ABC transporter ATP-binding protein [Spirochaetota bacterium]